MSMLRRALCVVVALSVVVGGLQVPEAVAKPVGSAPQAPLGPRSSLGDLMAADQAAARVLARQSTERVEVVGARTSSSSTWALPDGSMVLGQAAGPIWVRTGSGDGSKDADWTAVDVDLVKGADGLVRPKGHPGSLVLSGGGVVKNGELARVTAPSGQGSAVLEWSGSLPVPTLAGPRATYSDVSPGVDLVVEATRTGFEQFLVVKSRPAAGKAANFSSAIRVEGGLKATAGADGRVSVVASDGVEVASSGAAAAWDAAVDSERAHPVTQRFAWGGTETGLARSLASMPSSYLEQAKARASNVPTTKEPARTAESPRGVRRLETLGRLESCLGTRRRGIRLS